MCWTFRYGVNKEVSDELNATKIVNVSEDYNTDSLDSKVSVKDN